MIVAKRRLCDFQLSIERNKKMTYQINAPLLDACVLGIVNNEDAYGYTLTQKAQQVIDISESTLYPVLRRLQKSDFLTTYDVPYQGRNRRYYAITEKGKETLSFYRDEWEEYKKKIDELINASDVLTDLVEPKNASESTDTPNINKAEGESENE